MDGKFSKGTKNPQNFRGREKSSYDEHVQAPQRSHERVTPPVTHPHRLASPSITVHRRMDGSDRPYGTLSPASEKPPGPPAQARWAPRPEARRASAIITAGQPPISLSPLFPLVLAVPSSLLSSCLHCFLGFSSTPLVSREYSRPHRRRRRAAAAAVEEGRGRESRKCGCCPRRARSWPPPSRGAHPPLPPRSGSLPSPPPAPFPFDGLLLGDLR